MTLFRLHSEGGITDDLIILLCFLAVLPHSISGQSFMNTLCSVLDAVQAPFMNWELNNLECLPWTSSLTKCF